MQGSERCSVLPNTDVRTRLLTVFFFAALTGVCAKVSFRLWFTPVPLTLQVLGVILCGLVLGSRWGAISQLGYLAMGFMGLPVFAGFSAGPQAFVGPSAGYLFGFVGGAFAAGWVFERLGGRKIASWCGGIAGIAVIYLFGASWLAIWLSTASRQPLGAVLHSAWVMGVFPFIFVDVLKAAAASALALGGARGQGMIHAFRGTGAVP